MKVGRCEFAEMRDRGLRWVEETALRFSGLSVKHSDTGLRSNDWSRAKCPWLLRTVDLRLGIFSDFLLVKWMGEIHVQFDQQRANEAMVSIGQ